ncbi:MAG: hypothetical protein R3C05_20160 [Pirellulaceae bacterium]
METSLHQSLKALYADGEANTEVKLGSYRIDAVRDHELIEIQFGSLSAIRPKIQSLLKRHDVRVVKPIILTKRIVRQAKADGPVVSRRLSPKRGELLDIFGELIYFTTVFPHRRLVIEVPMVHVQHWRLPPEQRRRRRWKKDYKTKDYVLEGVEATHEFRTTRDLLRLIASDELPVSFDTAELADHLGRPRAVAQQIAYCLRKTGAVSACGKRGNAILYRAA